MTLPKNQSHKLTHRSLGLSRPAVCNPQAREDAFEWVETPIRVSDPIPQQGGQPQRPASDNCQRHISVSVV